MDMSMFAVVTFAPAVLVFLAGCTQLPNADPQPELEPAGQQVAVEPESVTPASGEEPPQVEPPASQPRPMKSTVERVEGTVLAIEAAGPYRYIEVEGSTGEPPTTVVVLGDAGFATGETGQFSIHGERTDFHSKRLDKTFPTLLFGSPDTPKS